MIKDDLLLHRLPDWQADSSQMRFMSFLGVSTHMLGLSLPATNDQIQL